MSKSNIQLQLATLKKQYLQKIMYPQVIVINSQKDERLNKYSSTFSMLERGIEELDTLQTQNMEPTTLV